MRRKRAALGEALTGRVTAHHRFLLAQRLHHVEFLDDAIATCDRHIATLTAASGDALERWVPEHRREAELDDLVAVAQQIAARGPQPPITPQDR